MNVQQALCTFKKYYFLIVLIPTIITAFQIHKTYKSIQKYSNQIVITLNRDNYVQITDIIKIVDNPVFNSLIGLSPATEIKSELQSMYQFKLTVTDGSALDLENSINKIRSFLSTKEQSFFNDLSNICRNSILSLIDEIKHLKQNYSDITIKRADTIKLQLRTKACITTFRQESNLIEIDVSEDGVLKRSDLNKIILNLESELMRINSLQIGLKSTIEVGKSYTKERIRFSDVVSIVVNFMFSTLFFTFVAAVVKNEITDS